MPLLCPHFTLTWYPGSYPDADDGVVLQSADHRCEASPALAGELAQAVQRADYLRAAAPGLWVRGGRALSLDWAEVREIAAPADALAAALAALEAMPAETGWLSIDIPDANRAWRAEPCAVRSAGWSHDPRRGLLRLRWALECGPLTEIPTDHDLLLETGLGIALEAGGYLELESAA